MMAQEMQQSEIMPSVAVNDTQTCQLREWLVLKMQTDEMCPAIYPNDDLIINTKEDFKNGDIAVCWHDKSNKVIIRRIYVLENCVVFTSDNRKYEPIICGTDEELNQYAYIGKISSAGRQIHK